MAPLLPEHPGSDLRGGQQRQGENTGGPGRAAENGEKPGTIHKFSTEKIFLFQKVDTFLKRTIPVPVPHVNRCSWRFGNCSWLNFCNTKFGPLYSVAGTDYFLSDPEPFFSLYF